MERFGRGISSPLKQVNDLKFRNSSVGRLGATGNFLHLNGGAKMPVIGLGMATEPIDSHQLKSLVLYAIQVGYRHFDSASLYTSQSGLGDALNEAMKGKIISREEAFVTSKVWCTDVHADDVIPSLQNSLRMLQLDYVDLYLIHFPVRLKKEVVFLNIKEDDILPFDIKSTWQAMEKCVELGLTKSIGVSNFSCKKIEGVLAHATITPSVNQCQVEMHPFWQQRKLREYCSKLNIHVSAYAPLGSPAKSWGSRRLLDSHVINGIAKKYSKTSGQLMTEEELRQVDDFTLSAISFGLDTYMVSADVSGGHEGVPSSCVDKGKVREPGLIDISIRSDSLIVTPSVREAPRESFLSLLT